MNVINTKIQINLKAPLSNYIKGILILNIIYWYIKSTYPNLDNNFLRFYDDPINEEVYIKIKNYTLEYEFFTLQLVNQTNSLCEVIYLIHYENLNILNDWQSKLDTIINKYFI